MPSLVRRTLLTPFWLAQVLTQEKFFARNPVLGNRWLNERGLHTARTSAAHRLAALHTGMYLLGCTYNFCWPHHELSRTAPDEATGKRAWVARTPAMASYLTDHVWSVFELLSYRVAPLPWRAPKRRGRPRTRPLPDPLAPKRPRGRPPKAALCSSTS